MDIQQAREWLKDPQQHFKGLALLSAIVRHNPNDREAAESLANALEDEELWRPVHSFEERCYFSECGQRLSITQDGTAQVWDAHTAQPITQPWRIWTHALPDRMWHQTFQLPQTSHLCHQGNASVCFSPDGQLIASAGEDGTVRLWNAQTGAPIGQPMVFSDSSLSARFSLDGSKVVVVYMNGSAQVLDPLTGQPLTKAFKHESPIQSAEFSPDGQLLLTSGADGQVCVWNLLTGEPDGTPLSHDLSVRFTRFSSDGARVLTVMFNVGVIWDMNTRRHLPNLLVHEDAITCVEFSPDGKHVATGSRDGEIGLWDTLTGKLMSAIPKHPGRITTVQFSPKGDCLMICSVDGVLRIVPIQPGEQTGSTMEVGGPEVVARFSADGKRIVTGTKNGMARIWDAMSCVALTAELPHVSNQHGYPINSVDFSHDGQRVLTACADCSLRIWNSHTGELIQQLSTRPTVACFARFTPDGQRIMAIVSHSDARIYDAYTGQQVSTRLGDHLEWPHIEFSADGKRLLSGEGRYHTMRVWDVQTQKPVTDVIKHLPMPSLAAPREMVTSCAALNHDGTRLVTGGSDGLVRVWDLHTGKEIFSPIPHWQDVISIVFSPDGSRFATTCHGNSARIWDAATGEPMSGWLEHENEVDESCFSKDGKVLATVSSYQVKVWNGFTGAQLMEPIMVKDWSHGFTRGLALNEDGSLLLALDTKSILRAWHVPSGVPCGQPLFLKEGWPVAKFITPDKFVAENYYEYGGCIWQRRKGVVRPKLGTDIDKSNTKTPEQTFREVISPIIHDLVELLSDGCFDHEGKWCDLDADVQIELIKKVEVGLRKGKSMKNQNLKNMEQDL